MKKLLLIVLLFNCFLFAQNVSVVNDKEITQIKEGQFYYPIVSPDGTGIIFSSEFRQGLWIKKFDSNKITKITNALSAGYEPGFGQNGEILFRNDNFINKKRYTSLVSYNLSTKKSVVIESSIRNLKLSKQSNNLVTNYIKNDQAVALNKLASLQKSSFRDVFVYVDNSKLIVTENGIKRTIEPLGEGNYIWPSLSPDKTKLLFTFAGRGTYVCDLNGNLLNKIGYANYPTWSSDGNWVLFMKDLDDGAKVYSSEIFMANIVTGKYINLTSNQDFISMYPVWGTSNTEVYYNTLNGQIRKITIKFE